MKLSLLIGAIMMVYVNSVTACNYKLLELQAGIFHTRITSQVQVQEPEVKQSLSFVKKSDIEKLKAQYTNVESFKSFLQSIHANITDQYFLEFTGICKKIFYQDIDDAKKIAVYMLLEKVLFKYEELMKLRSKVRHKEDSPGHIWERHLNPDYQKFMSLFGDITVSDKL